MKLHEITKPKTVAVISMDIPLFMRALEFARENAKNDIDLHKFVERCCELMCTKDQLKMKDYPDLVQDMKTDKGY